MSRFCVLNTEKSCISWAPITFKDMFESTLRMDGDSWQVCNVAYGEQLPSDIKEFQGIIITGSHYNCRDRDSLPWFEEVCELIRHAANYGSPNFYGGCFGCQMIAHALGGEVDYNPQKQFALKAEDIRLSPTFFKYLGSCQDCELNTDTLNIIVSHGECVVKLPPGSELLATSNSCAHEIFVTGEKKNIICCQSHPEFLDVNYTIMERIAPIVIDQKKRLVGEQVVEAMNSFRKFDGNDARKFLRAVSNFLHNHARASVMN